MSVAPVFHIEHLEYWNAIAPARQSPTDPNLLLSHK
jgi:hypothetical protein